ncbi:MAG: SdpI family protein [Pseudomonadota bacterium]
MTRTHHIIAGSLTGVAILLAAVLYQQLPDPMPANWNFEGQLEGTMPKPWGVLLVPLSMLMTWLFFELGIRLSPRGFRLDRSIRAVGIIMLVTLGFLLVVYLMQLAVALGLDVDVTWLMLSLSGILFIGLGNYLGKMPRNFIIGIRTPWTLAHAEVWRLVHRVGGWLFVANGILMILVAPLSASVWIVLILMTITVLFLFFYSLWLYRRLEGFGPEA